MWIDESSLLLSRYPREHYCPLAKKKVLKWLNFDHHGFKRLEQLTDQIRPSQRSVCLSLPVCLCCVLLHVAYSFSYHLTTQSNSADSAFQTAPDRSVSFFSFVLLDVPLLSTCHMFCPVSSLFGGLATTSPAPAARSPPATAHFTSVSHKVWNCDWCLHTEST